MSNINWYEVGEWCLDWVPTILIGVIIVLLANFDKLGI
jgi:hypothetical protein